jgi:hypothetical protein
MQWIEGGEMWGARVAVADPKWKLQESWHSNTVMCETCRADQIRFAHFWLGLADPAQRDVDKEVSPEFFAQMMTVLHMPLAEYRADGDSRPVTITGLEGKARKIGIRSSDGRFHDAIILSASRDCLYLTAIAAGADDREIPLERIDALSSAFDVRRYGPLPDPCPEDIPLLEKLEERPGCPWAAGDGK